MKFKKTFHLFFAWGLCGFVFFTAAGAFLPQVHASMHVHPGACSKDPGEDSQDFCSIQNHLAADLEAGFRPFFQTAPVVEERPRNYQRVHGAFIPHAISPRAPPLSPAK